MSALSQAWQVVQRQIPILNMLLSIRDAFFLAWSWLCRYLNKCKALVWFSLTIASIKAAVGVFGILFTKVQGIKAAADATAANTFGSVPAAQGALFDKVNAVLPVAETLAFIAAYHAILLLTTAYMFIRSLYNAVPAKAT